MVELRTLHLTDLHDDWDKYEVIADYIASRKDSEGAVDAVFITGDFIEGDEREEGKTANDIDQALKQFGKSDAFKEDREAFNGFIKKYGKDEKLDVSTLDEKLKSEFEYLLKRINAKQSEAATFIITEAYKKHAEALRKLGIPVFGILGNHDLIQGYDILGKNVTFLEKTHKTTHKGKTGVEFMLKGDLNTFEVPPYYLGIVPLIGKYFIPYESGYSLFEYSKEVNQLQTEISNDQNERLAKISKKDEPNSSEEEVKRMTKHLEQIIELRKEVLTYNQAERQRLGDKEEADIYLTHKLPSCKKANPKVVGHLSDVTTEYAANAKAVYGGHFHEGQIGYKTIEDLLKQESAETTTIDGVEVPVYYLDEKEPLELNPGTKYFFVTEYDTNKEIEQVILYEFFYEDTA